MSPSYPTPPAPLVRAVGVVGRTDDQYMVVVADSAFHKLRQFVTGMQRPLIKRDIDTIRAQPYSEISYPFAVFIAFPGIGEKRLGVGSLCLWSRSALKFVVMVDRSRVSVYDTHTKVAV